MSGIFGASGKNTITQDQRVSGIQLQTSSYGAPIGLYYGDNRATGNLVWYGDFQAIEHRSEQSQGGKGGGGATSTNISYTYRAGFIFALGEGQINITNIMPDNDGFKIPSALGIETFTGTIGQSVWGALTANHPTEAIGYSGLAGFRCASYDLGNSANMPNFSVKLIGQPQITTRLSGYITHFATDAVSGVGFPSIRLYGLNDVENYLTSQSVTFSPIAQEKKEAAEYLREWCNMANVETVWSEGTLKFKPRYDSTGIVANLTVDDFLVSGNELPVEMTRTDQNDAFNRLRINYLNATNDYNTATADFKDQANIDKFGLRPASDETYNAVKSAIVAAWVAEHRGKRKLYVRNEYKFKLGWKWARLEPMDVITITEPRLGLNADPVLIKEITENAQGDLEIITEEYNGLVNGVVEAAPIQIPAGGGIDQGVDPGNVNTPVIFQPPVALIPSGPEIWLAASGGAHWGGCEIWASLDDASYRRIGIQTGGARHGTLRSALANSVTPDATNTLAVHAYTGELLAGTTQDATDLITLMYVDGELLAYRDSTLMAAGDYDLSYLVRGAYGSARASHAINSKWARLDEKIFKYAVPKDWYDRTVYIKLISFNHFGLGTQSIADVTAYTHVISGSQPPAITGLSATVFQTTVGLSWAAPENVEAYSRVDILRSKITPADFNDAILIASVGADITGYNDSVGESNINCHYWIRLISVHGDVGIVTGPISATTATVGGIALVADASTITTTPSAGNEVVYSSTTKSIWAWQPASSHYVNTQDLGNSYYNLVAATRAAFGNLAAINADLGTITAGNLTLGLNGYVRQGQSAWNTGSGFWLGDVGGTTKFSVGNPAGEHFTWNGSVLSITGQVEQLTMTATGHVKGGQTAYNTGTGFFLGYSGAAYKFSIGNPAGQFFLWDGTNIVTNGQLTDTSPYAAGSITLAASNSINSISSTTMTLKKEIYVPRAGTITVLFDLKVGATAGYTWTARIYKNGAAVGTNRTQNGNNSNQTFTENITVAKNDLVQIYAAVDNASDANGYIWNFKIKANKALVECVNL